MEEPALYLPDGDAFVGTTLIQGGWNPDEANGAAVLALLGHCLEDVPTLVPMTMSRFTADLVRPVPLGRRLQVTSSIRREGKKIQVVELRLLVDDVEHVQATVLRLRDADLRGDRLPESTTDARPADDLVPVATISGHREPHPDGPGYLPGFLKGIDLRRAPTLDGTSYGSWLRLQASVVAGEPVRPTSRLTVGFDFANLVGVNDHVPTVTMINPDVTAHVLRDPVDEWIAVTGDTRFNPAMGRGVSTASLSDSQGVFATASVSQLLQRR